MNTPIRILHVVTHMNRGGLETMIMNYYRHMDRNQVQFDFLVHREERADYDDEIEALGGVIYRLPRLIPWSASYRKKLNAFFRNNPEYKIVHVHQDCLSSIILKAAKKAGVPVRIAHSHNSNQDHNLRYLIKLYYKQSIARYATDLFACGNAAGEWMFSGVPFTVLSNAIDVGDFRYNETKRNEIRSEYGISDDTFVIGHVGRFSVQKNHSFLIEVFAKCVERCENTRLLLIGDGELREEIQKKVYSAGLASKVIFAGIQGDISAYLQAMDVFVFPSLYEGVSLATIEAQASGIPCVFSDGIPKECVVTDLARMTSLNCTPEIWAEIILCCRSENRRDTFSDICNSGFSIDRKAQWLQDYYIAHWKGKNENANSYGFYSCI